MLYSALALAFISPVSAYVMGTGDLKTAAKTLAS